MAYLLLRLLYSAYFLTAGFIIVRGVSVALFNDNYKGKRLSYLLHAVTAAVLFPLYLLSNAGRVKLMSILDEK